MFGDLDTQDEQIGPNGYFTTVFSLQEETRHRRRIPIISDIAEMMSDYSTPTLEVATTVAYYSTQGFSISDAIKETKRMKPAISTPARFEATKELLKKASAIKDGKRSEST